MRTVRVKAHERHLPERLDTPIHRQLRAELPFIELEREIERAVIANLRVEFGEEWNRVTETW